MFERFTASARAVVIGAQEEARALEHRHIGSEHLLLALLRAEEGDEARATLEEFGLTHSAARSGLERLGGSAELDADALGSLGVDLDSVRERVEAQFGPGALDEAEPARPWPWWRRRAAGAGAGHIPFTPDAKVALELALREAIALRHSEIRSGHLLLGLLRGDGLGRRILQIRGLDPAVIRAHLSRRMRASA